MARRKSKVPGAGCEAGEAVPDCSPAPRVTLITKLDEDGGVLTDILTQINDGLSTKPQRLWAPVTEGLVRLRDLAYDADNKRVLLQQNFGVLDIMLDIVAQDSGEPRCKALGFLLTLSGSHEMIRLAGSAHEKFIPIINLLLTLTLPLPLTLTLILLLPIPKLRIPRKIHTDHG